jgi:glycosyltransferase involved in cell wall biosynthesis
MPTVAVCMFTRNHADWLRIAIKSALRWANQICVLDMGSTDDTQAICDTLLRQGDSYGYRPTNTVPELGFAEAANAAMSMATTDWALVSGDNALVKPAHEELVRVALVDVPSDVLVASTLTIHIGLGFASPDPRRFEEYISLAVTSAALQTTVERHRNLIRPRRGIEFRGYIHEEPYCGEENAPAGVHLGIVRYHASGWEAGGLHDWRHAWMIRNAMRNPKLRQYTNAWWYDVWYVANKDMVNYLATRYDEHIAAGNPG